MVVEEWECIAKAVVYVQDEWSLERNSSLWYVYKISCAASGVGFEHVVHI